MIFRSFRLKASSCKLKADWNAGIIILTGSRVRGLEDSRIRVKGMKG
jgi:hypothetical protein